MTSVSSSPRRGYRAAPDSASRAERRQLGRLGSAGAAGTRVTPDGHRPVGLRCPGPLVALRGLAALYGVSAQRLAASLPACETRARSDADAPPGALASAVSDALGSAPLTPTVVHYYHATWLRDPQLVVTRGLAPATTADAVWQCLGEVVSDVTRAKWAARQRTLDDPHDDPLRGADALDRGPRGCLVCDLLLRPALYGARDDLQVPALIEDLTVACTPYLGFDLAERFIQTTTPCIVEYRRPPAHDGHDVDVALSFVAAALRGTVSPEVIGGHDACRTPIAAHDVVSVRAIATQAEWTAEHPPQRGSTATNPERAVAVA